MTDGDDQGSSARCSRNEAFIQPADRTPPPPDLDRLRDRDIPTVSDETFDDSLDELAERRRNLLATVEADAWHWPASGD